MNSTPAPMCRTLSEVGRIPTHSTGDFFSTSDTLQYKDRKLQGLSLPAPILRKLYHDNAVRWIPGILQNPH